MCVVTSCEVGFGSDLPFPFWPKDAERGAVAFLVPENVLLVDMQVAATSPHPLLMRIRRQIIKRRAGTHR
jgi:hypothetical protein